MKKLILLLLILTPVLSISQSVTKLTGTQFTFSRLNEDTDEWDEWSPWKESGVLILIDSKEKLIKIFSEVKQEYKIITLSDEIERGEYSEFIIEAIDEEELACTISFIKSDHAKYKNQIIIRWDNIHIAYEVE